MFLPPVGAHPAVIARPGREPVTRPVAAVPPLGEARRRGEQAPPRLSAEELRTLELLRARDREVRMHEQARLSLGGTPVRAMPSYTYQRGPDGRYYAIDGELGLALDPGVAAGTPPEDTPDTEQARTAAARLSATARLSGAGAPGAAVAGGREPGEAAFDRELAYGLAAARFYGDVGGNAGSRRPLVSVRV